MGFDRIAVVYDLLAKIVFGKSIRESQVVFFPAIPKNSKILIVGGGSGWILKSLPSSCQVTYVDPSTEMTKLARRARPQLDVTFITRCLEDALVDDEFDVIITNFFLDLYSEEELSLVIQKLRNYLLPRGKWLATDFQEDGSWQQRYMLGIMYFFFKLTTGLKTSHLPNWKNTLEMEGMKVIRRREYFWEFIISVEIENM